MSLPKTSETHMNDHPVFSLLDEMNTQRIFIFREPSMGLKAFLVIDSLTLGPAAGGVRTKAYSSEAEALLDAAKLARAMTIKCSLAGLDAGGGKMVVMDHPGLDRSAAFSWLGKELARIDFFHTAGDLGTRGEDLQAMAIWCDRVRTDEAGLCSAVGQGVSGCIVALAQSQRRALSDLSVGIQGAGNVGAEVARHLAEYGCRLFVADTDRQRAQRVAQEVGAESVDPELLLTSDVDVVSPCATGGVITEQVAAQMKCWAVCGPANNELDSLAAAEVMKARGILHVPSVIAGAGAVIHGLCNLSGDLPPSTQCRALGHGEKLIIELGATAARLIEASQPGRELPETIATRWALARINGAR